jgi:PAS domain S-box-containing protein
MKLEDRLSEDNPDALVAAATDGRILHWNAAAETIFGFAAAEAVGQFLWALIVPADQFDEEKRRQEEALAKGLSVYESLRRRKDGALVHVSVSARAVRNPAGGLDYFLFSEKDVTRLKVLRDAKLVEARFRNLLESTPDAIVMVNVTGRIVLVNSQAEAMFGHPRGDLLGQTIEALLPARFRSAHLGHRHGYFRQPHTRTMGAGLALFGLRANGDEFPVEISLSPLETEEGTMVMSAIRDITSRRKADQKFKDLLETAPDAMVIVDRAGRMVLVNSQAVKLFGWSREELLGEPIEILVPERFRGQHSGHRGGFFAHPRARAMGAGLELFGRRKDGTEFPVEISLSPLETEEGLFVSSAIRDVTDRKLFEQALRDKNLELEKAASAKDRFFASMSHELRTPLNAILGFTGTLLMKLPGPLNPEQDRQLKIVQTGARHLLSLINDLLDLSRLGASKLELNLDAVDCRSVLDEVVEGLRLEAEKKGLVLTAQSPASMAAFQTDRRALVQILVNLAGNAIKFTDRGRVTLRMQQGMVAENAVLTVEVEDTGLGIPAHQQAGLFEPFSRVDRADRRDREGSGLGLHLSRRLAEALNGAITFRSELGQGSVFTLTLREA